MSDPFPVPEISELTEFFGNQPVDESVEDGYWCFEKLDHRGVTLRFSFNLFERSVQTTLSLSGQPLITVSHEQARQLRLRDGQLHGEFWGRDSRMRLTIDLKDGVSVRWAHLSTG